MESEILKWMQQMNCGMNVKWTANGTIYVANEINLNFKLKLKFIEFGKQQLFNNQKLNIIIGSLLFGQLGCH